MAGGDPKGKRREKNIGKKEKRRTEMRSRVVKEVR